MVTPIEIKLEQFEKHFDRRFDNLENAISILASESKENTKKIIEHNILISQNQIDIRGIGELTRNHEKSCQVENSAQHKKLFEKVDRLENDFSFYRGAIFLIPFILTALYFFINLYLSKK